MHVASPLERTQRNPCGIAFRGAEMMREVPSRQGSISMRAAMSQRRMGSVLPVEL